LVFINEVQDNENNIEIDFANLSMKKILFEIDFQPNDFDLAVLSEADGTDKFSLMEEGGQFQAIAKIAQIKNDGEVNCIQNLDMLFLYIDYSSHCYYNI
jgi:DNA repair ATPase RecN